MIWNAWERIAAAMLTVAFIPVFLIIGLMVSIRSARTPLLAHRRVGRFGKPFWMLKFRTMWGPGAPPPSGTGWAGLVDYAIEDPNGIKPAADTRVVGRFARFLRRYSVDELPQLLHVISGQMALVGPRPLTADEWRRHYGGVAEEILKLRPGMTGLWQVMGRSRLTYPQRRRLDVFLTRHQSVRLNLWILARTATQVLAGKDSW